MKDIITEDSFPGDGDGELQILKRRSFSSADLENQDDRTSDNQPSALGSTSQLRAPRRSWQKAIDGSPRSASVPDIVTALLKSVRLVSQTQLQHPIVALLVRKLSKKALCRDFMQLFVLFASWAL